MSSNPTVGNDLLIYLIICLILFVSFSHLLVTRTSPPCVKRQEMMKTVELEFKAYVEAIAYIQIRILGDS